MVAQPRIAHVVADGAPGGGSTMLLGLVDETLRAGMTDITVVSQPGTFVHQAAAERGLAFVGFDFFAPGLLAPGLPWRLARALGDRSFDLTHVHGLRAGHHATREPVQGRWGRIVYTVHGLHQLHQPLWLRVLANHADRRLMRRVDATVFVARADAALARQWRLVPPDTDPLVIHNGVDVAALQAWRARPEIDVLFLARHVAQKGPDTAARVLAALAAEGYRCTMAGGGPLLDDCRRLLRALPGGDRVASLGELPHEEALRALATARVLVMPSRWEGLPVLPMEAMALGVPVVASRLAGTAEVTGEGAALLTPVDDVQAMVAAARRLLGSDALAAALRSAGETRVRELFDRGRCARRYLQLYAQLLACR